MHAGEGARRPSRTRIVVIKLGGSVITDKSSPFTPRIALMRSLAREIASLIEDGWNLVVVLGGGSYGHVVAKEYMYDGRMSTGEALAGITRVMLELALLFSEILAEYGVHAVVYPPHSFCKPRGLKPNCDWSLPARAFWYDAVPLTYGDAYPGYTSVQIISGDEIAVEAACSLSADLVVYLSNVPGVLDSEGKVIPLLTRAGLQELLRHGSLGSSRGFDVTGGMRRKLLSISELGCPGLRVLIASGEKPGILQAAVNLVKGIGTWIEL